MDYVIRYETRNGWKTYFRYTGNYPLDALRVRMRKNLSFEGDLKKVEIIPEELDN